MFVELLLLAVLVFLLYLSLNKSYVQFKDTGLEEASHVPLLGSLWRTTFRKLSMVEDIKRMYDEVGDERSRYIGFYNFLSPVIMLKDPEIIKQITVKDFDSFSEHRMTINEDIEPLFGKNLVALRGQKWRDMRSTLSPAFTSSKIRDMCHFIEECGEQMNAYLSERCQENIVNGVPQFEAEMKDISCRYMNDVIANTAFGYKVDSFKDQDNQFFTLGMKLTNIKSYQFFKMVISLTTPKIGKFLNLRIFPDEINHFFRNLVLDTMKHRKENNIVRRDMIHLLMEAKKGSLKHEPLSTETDAGFATVEESHIGMNDLKTAWSDDDLVAQAMLFFFGGFDTSSTLMSFLVHELAFNHDVQKKLQDEVDENVSKQGQGIYDVIQQMKYLDMVVSEALRKWTPGVINDRYCVKDFNLGPMRHDGDATYMIPKNTTVWTPVHAIHHDPKYWSNPEKFDPERFSDENKDNIKPCTYLPFGSGPRNCIGSRFALMEAKIMVYYLMMKFSFDICPKTNMTAELDRTTFNLKLKNGFWVKIMERQIKK